MEKKIPWSVPRGKMFLLISKKADVVENLGGMVMCPMDKYSTVACYFVGCNDRSHFPLPHWLCGRTLCS